MEGGQRRSIGSTRKERSAIVQSSLIELRGSGWRRPLRKSIKAPHGGHRARDDVHVRPSRLQTCVVSLHSPEPAACPGGR